MHIDAALPGGNIIVERIDGDDVYLRQDPRDTEGWWFYWLFRVREAQGRTLTFRFTDGPVVGVRGPAVNTGGDWRWLGAECDTGFTYAFGAKDAEVKFGMSIPYTRHDWDAFLAARGLRDEVLCRSRRGRPVPALVFGNPASPHRVLLTARHHCCESIADFVLEGVITAVLDGACDAAFLAVPFVDADGVEDGDQGKNRRPYDHGRDYAVPGLYPETAAIRRRVDAWTPAVMLDLHCPWIRGGYNEIVYQVGTEHPPFWAEQQRLAEHLEACAAGLPYRAANDLPFGVDWNTAANYTQGLPPSAYYATRPEVRLFSGFEIPYANAGGVEVTPARARQFGAGLAAALARYLR
jgi:hypothetical protein